MENYRTRLFMEYGELGKKIGKLKDFIISEKYDTLSDIDKTDLKEQLTHMKAYYKVILRRVSRQCNNA